jgi:hypothetical protein
MGQKILYRTKETRYCLACISEREQGWLEYRKEIPPMIHAC